MTATVAQFYEQQGAEIGSFLLGRHKRAAELLRKHASTRPHTLLDIGCGAGVSTVFYRDAVGGPEVKGVDISAPAAAAARARGVDAAVVNLDREDLPFDANSFDATICGELLEHILDIDHLLDEIHRTLMPGGLVAFTTGNLAAWYNRIALLLGWQPYFGGISYRHNVGHPHLWGLRPRGGSGRLRPVTPRALRELLTLHNLRVEEMTAVSYLEGYRADALPVRLLGAVDRLAARVPGMGGDIVCVARKVDGRGARG